ncbi:thiamine pyrophosphate-binding protein [Leucobacter triazinivorans]|nr:thiamine pyrophosphate-binding protein [Leucobacter triazinivorans]
MHAEIPVAHIVGRTLAVRGVDTVYGVVGSGNYEATSALRGGGARFIAARHEGAAVSMADAHHRASGRIAAVTVHQGPGLTNALTALGEAAKSGVPLVVLAGAAAASARRSNFLVNQEALAVSVGAGVETLTSPETAAADTARAHQRAREEMRPIVLNMPIDLQEVGVAFDPAGIPAPRERTHALPATDALDRAVAELRHATRPVIVAGRGAWLSGAGATLSRLAERLNAPLMTSAMALGMFAGDPRDRGICGGFSDPQGVETLESADLLLAVGASLTSWTTRGGSVFAAHQRIIRVDSSPTSIDAGVSHETLLHGDADATARALLDRLGGETPRSTALRLRAESRDPEPRTGAPTTRTTRAVSGWVDADAATVLLDTMLPEQRTLVVDGGHFIGWPVRGIRVPDPSGFIFSSAGFQSIGLGMGSAVGAAIARPDRLTVLATGDGGYQMAISELETMIRLQLPILVAVYNDAAYGAEVHHFGPDEPFVDQVRFPAVDIAAAAAGAGATGLTVTTLEALERVKPWMEDPRGPLVLDMRIDPSVSGPWAEQDFLRH